MKRKAQLMPSTNGQYALDQYRRTLQQHKDLSAITFRNYLSDLRQLIAWCEDFWNGERDGHCFTPQGVAPSLLVRYRDSLQNTLSLKPSTVNRTLMDLERKAAMEQQTYFILFDDASPSEASRYADELSNAILDATPDVTLQRERSNPNEQDFGTTLVLILGAPATVAIATAISNWLKMRYNASLTIKNGEHEIVVQNVTSKDAVQLAIQLTKKTETQ